MPTSATLQLVHFRAKVQWLVLWLLIVPLAAGAQTTEVLPGTEPLTAEGDLSAAMVAGIDKFLMGELDRSVPERQKLWKRDFSPRAACEQSWLTPSSTQSPDPPSSPVEPARSRTGAPPPSSRVKPPQTSAGPAA